VLFYIFLSYPSASSPMRHGPPSRALSRAGRLSAIRSRLGFHPPPNNLRPGRRPPPLLEPPYPGASALRRACRIVDHRSVLLVSFCQDVMQVSRAKPACLSSIINTACLIPALDFCTYLLTAWSRFLGVLIFSLITTSMNLSISLENYFKNLSISLGN
jgi:hypothetical protein